MVSPKFQWSIDELALLKPADIELPHPDTWFSRSVFFACFYLTTNVSFFLLKKRSVIIRFVFLSTKFVKMMDHFLTNFFEGAQWPVSRFRWQSGR